MSKQQNFSPSPLHLFTYGHFHHKIKLSPVFLRIFPLLVSYILFVRVQTRFQHEYEG